MAFFPTPFSIDVVLEHVEDVVKNNKTRQDVIDYQPKTKHANKINKLFLQKKP